MIVDGRALEAAACGCYAAVNETHARVLSSHRWPELTAGIDTDAYAAPSANFAIEEPSIEAVRRVSSRAISFGRNTKSTHPVSMALMGMLGKRADPGYCANVVPQECWIARAPRAPSPPAPERTTPIAPSPWSSASEVNRISPG
jgi:hypothetical protein